jgi:hypothetical protein
VACALLIGVTFIVGVNFGAASPADGTLTAISGALTFGGVIALLAYLICVVPVTLVIVPLYAALEARGRANALTSAAVGAVPGLVMLIYSNLAMTSTPEPSLGMQLGCVITGASVALGLHVLRTWNTGEAQPRNHQLERTRT